MKKYIIMIILLLLPIAINQTIDIVYEIHDYFYNDVNNEDNDNIFIFYDI